MGALNEADGVSRTVNEQGTLINAVLPEQRDGSPMHFNILKIF
jgi:hypothetical protein